MLHFQSKQADVCQQHVADQCRELSLKMSRSSWIRGECSSSTRRSARGDMVLFLSKGRFLRLSSLICHSLSLHELLVLVEHQWGSRRRVQGSGFDSLFLHQRPESLCLSTSLNWRLRIYIFIHTYIGLYTHTYICICSVSVYWNSNRNSLII